MTSSSLPRGNKGAGSAAAQEGEREAGFTHYPILLQGGKLYSFSPEKSLITGPNGQDLSVAGQKGLYPGVQELPLSFLNRK